MCIISGIRQSENVNLNKPSPHILLTKKEIPAVQGCPCVHSREREREMKTIYVKDIFRKVPRIGGIKWKKCIPWKQAVPTFLFLGAMFLLGRSAGEIMSEQ